MMLKAVYTDTDDLDPTAGTKKLESAGFEVLHLQTHNAEEIVAATVDADALLLGYAPISAEMLKQMKKLQIVSLLSTGYDNIDIETATSLKICVSNIGATSVEEVATHALALTLTLSRGIETYREVVSRREWFKTPYPFIPPRLSNKKLGVIGFGNIGRQFARIAQPLFASVAFYDPMVKVGDVSNGFESKSLDELLADSDVISLHLPLMPQTHNLFNDKTFAQMKNGSIIINVSRGGLIEPAALLRALNTGKIASAGLDVLEVEPPAADDPLLAHPRVLITPHIAFLSEHSISAYIDVQAENILQWFRGDEVKNSVNGIRVKK